MWGGGRRHDEAREPDAGRTCHHPLNTNPRPGRNHCLAQRAAPGAPYQPHHHTDCPLSPLLQHCGCVSLGGQHHVPTAGQQRAGLAPPLGQGGGQRRPTAFSNCNKEFSHPFSLEL
jgi:hypothetical protein